MARHTVKFACLAALLLASGCVEKSEHTTQTNHIAPISPVSQATSAARGRIASVKPVMVIRFNQQHVYAKEAIEKVAREILHTRPNASYEARSLVPAGVQTDLADKNLRKVLAEFARNGVTIDRVDVRQASPVASQEIQIFVH